MSNRAGAVDPVTGSSSDVRAPSDGAASVDPIDGNLPEGSRFGGYVIGPCIGRGGMARVYRAEHEGLKRQVALKMLTHGFERDASGRERFVREARIAAAIRHPHVVSIFDVGLHQDVPYLVMELLDGEDLEQVLATRGALDPETLIDIAVPVIAGLAAVHDAGVVHRDLKPANIFLARGPHGELEPKLLDFGISRSSWAEHTRLTAASGVLLGTPCYLSPEAISGGEITTLSDQYSLGVLLYECATGVNPFQAANVVEVLSLIKSGAHTPASRLASGFPKRLAQIIERAMSPDPRRRYPDTRQLGRELLVLAGNRTRVTWALSFGVDLDRAVAAGQGVTAALTMPTAPPARTPERSGTQPSVMQLLRERPRWPKVALGATAALALLGAAVLQHQKQSLTPPVASLGTRQATPALQPRPPLARREETAPSPELPPAPPQVTPNVPASDRAIVRAARSNERPRTAATRSRRPRLRAATSGPDMEPPVVSAELESGATDHDLLWVPELAAGAENGRDPLHLPLSGTNQAPIFD